MRACDGTRLAVRCAGPPDAPPILLLHGFSQGSLCWVRQLGGPLAQRFRLIAPDLRGHGMSEPGPLPALGREETFAGDAQAVLSALATRPAVVVGWSYGGRVVCALLRAAPEMVCGMGFVAAVTQSVPGREPTPVGPGAAPLKAMQAEDDAVSLPATVAFVDAASAAPLSPAVRDLMVAVNAKVSPAVRAAMQTLVSDNDALLAAATAPTLIVHGCEDAIIRPAASERLATIMPEATLTMIEGLGHVPFLEAPDRFDTLLAEFADDAFARAARAGHGSVAGERIAGGNSGGR